MEFEFEGEYYRFVFNLDTDMIEKARNMGRCNKSCLVMKSVEQLKEIGLTEHLNFITRFFTEEEKINFLLALVQSIPYEIGKWQSALTTIHRKKADCKGKSILLTSLLISLGISPDNIVFLNYSKHIALGVAPSDGFKPEGPYYDYNGKQYFPLDATYEGSENKWGYLVKEYDGARIEKLR
ncbi:MAG: hypothetical protein AB1571_02575 [Nanoarchaeota archaeon]